MSSKQQFHASLQPKLQGELLTLRPMLESDFEALYAVASDPLLWEQHPASNRYLKPEFEAFFIEAITSKGALVAIDSVSQKVIGTSRYHDYRPEDAALEIGWTFLSRSHWGGAYNKDMKRLMLEHAFTFADSVLFVVGVDNIRSQRAVMKIGGVEIGRRANANGADNVVFQITKTDYAG